MKKIVKITESQLNNVISKIIKEGESNVSQDLTTYLKNKGFKKEESLSSVDFSYGNDNEGLFVIYYKDIDNEPYYVFRLTGGQYNKEIEPFSITNPKKVFDKKYNVNQTEEMKRDIETEIKKVKTLPRA